MNTAQPVHFFDIDSILPGKLQVTALPVSRAYRQFNQEFRAYKVMVLEYIKNPDGLELQKYPLRAKLYIIS